MQKLETLIPPPLVALIFCVLTYFLNKALPVLQFEMNQLFLYVIAASFVLDGIAVSAAGVLSFKKAQTTVNPLKPEQASTLVNTGIYRFTRNPMYLGMAFILLGWSLFLSSFIFVLVLPAFILYLTYFQIIPEERALEKIFGEEFNRFKQQTRRWL